jgi:uncharacterized protein
MRVVVFGANGRIGAAVVDELLRRNHTVLAVVRKARKEGSRRDRLLTMKGDATDERQIERAVSGADAVVSAIGPPHGGDPLILSAAARALLSGLRKAGVPRLVVVGGAGSLEVRPGVQLLDTPEFPAAWLPLAIAHRDALGVFREDQDLDWTVVSPAAEIEPGSRTGHYRAGGDGLLVDSKGRSRISIPDFAVAVVDEVETPRHIRRRFTVASA